MLHFVFIANLTPGYPLPVRHNTSVGVDESLDQRRER